ncbi:MAG TPA: ATP-grasp domain-containing protein [Cellvibrio sp.]|nr:ATP-grasp domain-containing protein [Cellvibrio sp.]
MTHLILVLDAAQRSALAVTRSLGKIEGITVVTAEASSNALAGTSCFSNEFIQCPSSTNTPQDFIAWLQTLCSTRQFSLIIPVTEITSQLLLMHQAQLPQVILPFASYNTVMSLADKHQLLLQAQQSGVPVPAFTHHTSAATLQSDSITYPCVIKPCKSRIYTPEGWISTSVKLVSDRAELDKVLHRETYLQHSPFMVQEFIPGTGAGLFCLYHHGKAIAFFAHRRLREKPPQGGVSVLSESIEVDKTLQHYAQQLLDHVGWHGVAMVEFRVTPDGKPYLMEVNTRFWGSLQLAIDSGVDFPRWLVELALGKTPVVPSYYRIGQRLRWLLGDLDSLYLYLKSKHSAAEKFKRAIQFITPGRHTRHEVNRFGDWKPAWFECKLYLSQLLKRGH